MPVTIVHVYVKPEFVTEFLLATELNYKNSILENGNIRFDVLQDESNPCKFVLYEAYENEASVLAHKETSHYLKWRDTVAPMMAKPREGVKHRLILPSL